MEKHKLLLLGRKFELWTDCRALEYIFMKRTTTSARLERWVLRVQCFDFDLVHIPGKANIAYALSRMPLNENYDVFQEYLIRQVIEDSKPSALTWKALQEHTSNDKEITAVMEAIYDDYWDLIPKYYQNVKNELTTMDGLLCRRDRIVIPIGLRDKVLDLAHEGHAGIVGTKERLRSKIWFPKMDLEVKRKVGNCKDCTVHIHVTRPTATNHEHKNARRTMGRFGDGF